MMKKAALCSILVFCTAAATAGGIGAGHGGFARVPINCAGEKPAGVYKWTDDFSMRGLSRHHLMRWTVRYQVTPPDEACTLSGLGYWSMELFNSKGGVCHLWVGGGYPPFVVDGVPVADTPNYHFQTPDWTLTITEDGAAEIECVAVADANLGTPEDPVNCTAVCHNTPAPAQEP